MNKARKRSVFNAIAGAVVIVVCASVAGVVGNKYSKHGVILFPRPHKGLQIVTTDRARWLHEQNTLFVDARSPDMFGEGHVPGAYNFDFYNSNAVYGAFASKYGTSTPMLVYCEGISGNHNEDTCSTSRLLAEYLVQRGYSGVLLYEQGMAFWKKAGLPVETGSSPAAPSAKTFPLVNYIRDLAMLALGIAALAMMRGRGAMAVAQVVLGAIFIYSGASKLFHADKLMVILEAYRILPPVILPFAASCVPWVEFCAGVALLSLVFAPSGALVIAGMNLFFIPALLYRAFLLTKQLGIPFASVNFDCGCGLGENFAWVLVLRDAGFLFMAIAVFFAGAGLLRAGYKSN
jgi:rhodanese-related sulfurtransferase/uncharacterized membrane protein YphA (DoxX/SURF4 family)